MDKSKVDPQDMFNAIYNFADHIKDAIKIGQQITLTKKYTNCKNVIVTGMGGSAIGADIVKTLINHEVEIPFLVNRNYTVPNWVNNNSLVICASYSGNTEETLGAYQDAKGRGAMLCGISTGGKLTEKMLKSGYDLIKIPGGLQPRAALAYSVIPILFLLNKLGLITNTIHGNLAGAIKILEEKRVKYSLGDSSNPIFKLAKNIYGMVPIIYGNTGTTTAIALRWKQQLCENSKMIAFHNEIPEMNHNEIVGWENNPDLLAELSVIWLRNKDDNERLRIRQKITEELLNEINIMQYEVSAEGDTDIERMLDLINYGDWLSYWCAILHDTDPTPVAKISKLKQFLEDSKGKV